MDWIAEKLKRAVIITGPGFQDEEFIYPYYRLLEADFQVDVATKDGIVVYGKYGVPARATMDTRELEGGHYDLVVLPGGTEAPDRVRQDKRVLDFVKQRDAEKKIIAAICHGPWIMISARIVQGRKATCYVGMADDLKNAGATYVDASVVEDGNLITAPHYRDNGSWMKAVLKRFEVADG